MARPATRPGRPATRPVGVTSPLGPRSHVLAYGRPRREPKRSCKPHVSPRNRGIGSSPETVWPSTSGPRTVSAAFEPLEVKFCPNCPSRLTSADGNPLSHRSRGGDDLLTAQTADPVQAEDYYRAYRYGAGIFLNQDGTLWHDGDWEGFLTSFRVSDDRRTAVAVSCNRNEGDAEPIATTLMSLWT